MSHAMASLHTTIVVVPAPRKLTISTPNRPTAQPKRTTSTHVPHRARLAARPLQRLATLPLALFFL